MRCTSSSHEVLAAHREFERKPTTRCLSLLRDLQRVSIRFSRVVAIGWNGPPEAINIGKMTVSHISIFVGRLVERLVRIPSSRQARKIVIAAER